MKHHFPFMLIFLLGAFPGVMLLNEDALGMQIFIKTLTGKTIVLDKESTLHLLLRLTGGVPALTDWAAALLAAGLALTGMRRLRDGRTA